MDGVGSRDESHAGKTPRRRGAARRAALAPFDAVARRLLGTITEVKTDEPLVALTFDDGPDPEWTPRLLDLLARYDARATFFVLGRCAHQHPALIERTARAGHAIGNHSWDHPLFSLINSRERRRQIEACARAIAPHGERLFRPPFGRSNLACQLDAFRVGYEVVTSSVDVGDWWNGDSAQLAKLLLQHIRPGSVIDLHDTLYQVEDAKLAPTLLHTPFPDREPMLTALQVCLQQLQGKFRFVTLPELLARGTPVRKMV